MTFGQCKEKAKTLPLKPGVYLMLDKTGKVIYIGKAKQLKNRVSSYFQESAGHTEKTRRMVSNVCDFDVIVAGSEFEALVLECSLIKQHQPKYNILLKDSKGYPFIRLRLRDEYPVFSVVYQPDEKDNARYFGPYGGRGVTYQVITALSQALKLPVCKKVFPRDIGKERCCLEYHLKRCVGVCQGAVTPEAYAELIGQAVLMLEGKQMSLVDQLRAEMETAAENLLFEKAAMLRDRINAVLALGRRQIVVGGSLADTDVIAAYAGETRTGVAVLHYKLGDLLGCDVEVLGSYVEEKEALTAFLPQYYLSRRCVPKQILLSHDIEDKELMISLLAEKLSGKTSIAVPKRGDKAELIRLAKTNAMEEVERITTREEKTSKLLSDLQKLLGMEKPPRRIEAVDISNTGEADRVGVVTCFMDGKPLKREYRHFIIKDSSINDDYHSMKEVLTRRFKRLNERSEGFSEAPDLLLVDGGGTHAKMGKSVIEEFELEIPVYGMVKDEKHRTRALMTPEGMEIGINSTPALFAFIGRIQEETHHGAISFHQKRRSAFSSVLENIDGIGKKRRNTLINHFKSIKEIEKATEEELSAVVPRTAALRILEYFKNKDGMREKNGESKER